jgi:hypothetical protein
VEDKEALAQVKYREVGLYSCHARFLSPVLYTSTLDLSDSSFMHISSAAVMVLYKSSLRNRTSPVCPIYL